MERVALRTVAERDPRLPVPAVIPDSTGRSWSTTSIGEGPLRLIWMLSYLPGRPVAGVRPVTPELLEELGATLARLDVALAGFSHPSARRELKWDLARAGWIREHLGLVRDPRRRAIIERPWTASTSRSHRPCLACAVASFTATPTNTTSSYASRRDARRGSPVSSISAT